ncbi:hypothetical protein GIB67_008436 [Kingdonia uniflora]|uniref:Glycosyltransferase n=1 Tax=Kingdonia uniflora TaxID=39325 RepID=A0A7J7N597_9MAGN|nr:hypothetical protein GIB67_008436 [Kingdonia uniflora]
MEKKSERKWIAHVLVLPFPVQGHINPMLQFSKRLVSKGLKVTIAISHFITKTSQFDFEDDSLGSLTFESFSDGCDQGGIYEPESFKIYLERFETIGSRSIAKLIEKLDKLGDSVIKCLVYDSVIPWALDLAKGHDLKGASFFTQSCAVDVIYYNVHRGLLSAPVKESTVSLPGLPLLELQDLPSYVCDWVSDPVSLDLVLSQFSNIENADWLLFNTFHKLESEVVKWVAEVIRIKTIGPTVPSAYLDNRVAGDKNYGLNLFKSTGDTCINWLNTKDTGSVIYVSFGSVVILEENQMKEIALALKTTGHYFLWVVREKEERKLPTHFKDEISDKGLVVTWCPQLEVLAHRAIRCFVSHCGWNSTLEALSLGVPIVGLPRNSDQTTNAKFIESIWDVGVRAKKDEKGVVRRDEIEKCVREVMVGERAAKVKGNARKWRDLAKEAVDEGGSSDRNIDEFVATLVGNSCNRS